jgi:hypothetical protein
VPSLCAIPLNVIPFDDIPLAQETRRSGSVLTEGDIVKKREEGLFLTEGDIVKKREEGHFLTEGDIVKKREDGLPIHLLWTLHRSSVIIA